MDSDCIFCRIIAGEIPSNRVYEDDTLIAFRDIHPQAPVHVLVVPREHVGSLSELEEKHRELAGHLLVSIPKVAEAAGGLDHGYRLIVNNGRGAGQTVPHLHLHILGGRQFEEGMIPR